MDADLLASLLRPDQGQMNSVPIWRWEASGPGAFVAEFRALVEAWATWTTGGVTL